MRAAHGRRDVRVLERIDPWCNAGIVLSRMLFYNVKMSSKSRSRLSVASVV